MFTSALTSLRTQTDKLKVKVQQGALNLNSDNLLEFSSRLKSNVIEKSAWLGQRLELLSSTSSSNDVENAEDFVGYGRNSEDSFLYGGPTPNPYNFPLTTKRTTESRSLSSYFRTKVSVGKPDLRKEMASLELDGRNNNETGRQEFNRRKRRKKKKGKDSTGKPRNGRPLDKTWIEMDKRNNPGRNGVEKNGSSSSELSTSSSDSEDEDISERFERVISSSSTGVWSQNTNSDLLNGNNPILQVQNRRSDRDEIRRRLALESEELGDKPGGRKPSLHSRLQSTSDSESPGSDTEAQNSSQQPASLPCIKAHGDGGTVVKPTADPMEDFCVKQTRLQAEARQALSQAKEMARNQMTQEKERRLQSPITEMVRNSLKKVGMSLPPERRRVSRQLLTEMNVTQLQVIVNDLHTHIEVLNETLVSMLLERDDLHMEQDSMLVDIEDLTRYLAAKDNSPHQSLPLITPGKSILGKK